MRLVVKHEGAVVQESRFAKGPVYIGRHNHNQIVLTNRSVSRQHTVLYMTPAGQMIVEDLHSANGTFLNGNSIDKAHVKSGDVLRIADYTIEIELDDSLGATGTSHLDDTMMPVPRQAQVIARKFTADHGPDLLLPVHRAKDFAEAASAICRANGPDETAKVLVGLLLEQFQAQRAWCGLREGLEGPLTTQAGKIREGQDLALQDLELRAKIDHAMQTSQFLLLPQGVPAASGKTIQSAMIGPIVESRGCLGVLYVDNPLSGQDHYHVRDLDYLMLLAIHTGAVLENF